MIEGDMLDSLAEGWDKHIEQITAGLPIQKEEYHDRQADYLGGAVDVLSVYATAMTNATNGGRQRLTVQLMADTFYQLLSDTIEQHQNLLKMLHEGGRDAQPDNAMDDKPKPV